MILLETLKQNPNNPRKIKNERLEKLAQSIREFPKMMELRPIVIDESGMILGGNQRFAALKKIGYTEIPDTWVKSALELSPEERRRFIVVDNEEFGETDWSMISEQYDNNELLHWGVELDESKTKKEVTDDDYEIPDEVQTDIVIGDLFEIGPHRLLCGDSTQTDTFTRLFGDQLADLVVTDPPYNVDYTGKTKDALKIQNDKMADGDFYQFLYDFYTALGSFTKRGGVWYVWHADLEGMNFRKAFLDAGIQLKQCLIWKKDVMVMGRQDYHWQHEPCLYGWKEGAAHGWYSDRKQTTVLEFERPKRNAEHPTMKPVPLIAYQIGNSSKQGDIVADGFGGSGTTMVAAHQLGRKGYLVEYDPKYCQVIIDRMRKLDPLLTIKKNGETINAEKTT